MGWWDKRPRDSRGIGDGDGDGNGNGNARAAQVPAQENAVVPFLEPGKPSRRAFLERQIADHIKDNPDAIARLIRRWLREDEE